MRLPINPETLKSLRNERKMTQAQLAERISCNPAQVSRWERGKNLRLRSDLREKLANALRVDWDTLTRPPSATPDGEPLEMIRKEQLNVLVKGATKTALDLVCLRYGVKPSTVVDLAPLLFLITAENSLRTRQQKLQAAWHLMSEAEKTALPHIGKQVFYNSWEDRVSEEQKSISDRDIFAKTLDGNGWDLWDEESDCPYTNYLRELATELIKEGDVIADMSPNYGNGPSYTVALDTFRETTGIDDSTERGGNLRFEILNRYIKLQDVIAKRQELDNTGFQIWLDEAQNEAATQKAEDFESLIRKAGMKISDFFPNAEEEAE